MVQEDSLLLSLSPELLGAILDFIDEAQDLLSLRLVCRTIEAFAEQRVAERCFGTISILYSFPKSLRNALQIARHPVFGKAVRSVYVQECTLSTQVLADTRFPEDFDVSKGDHDPADLERKRRHYSSLLEDQEKLFRTDEDYTYIEDIFRSLQAHGQRLRVVVEDVRELSRRAAPARNLAVNSDESIPESHRAVLHVCVE